VGTIFGKKKGFWERRVRGARNFPFSIFLFFLFSHFLIFLFWGKKKKGSLGEEGRTIFLFLKKKKKEKRN
jgi:hypothetical protein